METLEKIKLKAYITRSNLEDRLAGRRTAKTAEELDKKIKDSELAYWQEEAAKVLKECKDVRLVRSAYYLLRP